MLVRVTGVLQDGSPLGNNVPSDPSAPLEVPLGTSFELDVTVVTASGVPVPLAGSSLEMTVRKRPFWSPIFPALAAVLAPTKGRNVASFTITPTNTRSITPGTYVYDVWLTDGSGNRNAVIPLSGFNLLAVATPP